MKATSDSLTDFYVDRTNKIFDEVRKIRCHNKLKSTEIFLKVDDETIVFPRINPSLTKHLLSIAKDANWECFKNWGQAVTIEIF